MLIVITYDIPVDRRRVKLAKILLDYGERVQYSVFECDLSGKQLTDLLAEIEGVMDEEADSVRVYRLCGSCAGLVRALGQAEPPAEPPTVFLV